jgi:hypothetical protein
VAVLASWLAWAAASALWLTVPASCSTLLAVCCRLLAVCSVRWLRSTLPWAISLDAVLMLSTEWRTVAIISARRRRMASTWRISSPTSSWRRLPVAWVRSPLATACTALPRRASGRATQCCMAMCRATPMATAVTPSSTHTGMMVA